MLPNHPTQVLMSTDTPTSLKQTEKMIGKPQHNTLNPTVYTSPWDAYKDPTAEIFSSSSSSFSVTNGNASPTHYLLSSYDALLTTLSRYLPSNEPSVSVTDLTEPDGVTINSDEFRMYEFKVRMCTRAKAHDWTECPFAHPGEKARRRDPRRYSYSGTACTDFRKGGCRRGDACDFSHGVFECWLHPTRYRTQACKDGSCCTRRVCFFAHSPAQLRVVSGQRSPVSIGSGSPDPFEESPPVTPVSRAYGPGTVGDLTGALRNLQLIKLKSMPSGSGWKGQAGLDSPRFGPSVDKAVRTGFYSLPTTPTQIEVVMERPAECSGRELRLRMWEKLSGENRVDIQEPVDSNPGGPGPDIGWVSELLK